jgi:Tol biopolymer transport system component
MLSSTFIVAIFLFLIHGNASAAAATNFVSISTSSAACSGNCLNPSVSGDGRYVAFSSDAADLVSGDTNGCMDVFVRDTVSGTTTRVSVSSSGVQGNGNSQHPSISADGRYVAFESLASNLVSGDTNVASDIFVHDMITGNTVIASVSSAGVIGNAGSYYPCISADGTYVAFQSDAANLVSGDTNVLTDIFVRNLVDSTTERVSVATSGAQAMFGNSTRPAISYDGRYVAFQSTAMNLVPGDTNPFNDIFVRDRTLGTTERVSISTAGVQASGGDSVTPSISADGRYVAFASAAMNLVSNDTNPSTEIFVRDRTSSTTTIVSVASDGTVGANGVSSNPSISADGAFVAFDSGCANLVSNDTNGCVDVFIHNMSTGATELGSQSSSGAIALNGNSTNPSLSANGRFAAFASSASGLYTISNLLSLPQIYIRDRGAGSGGTDNVKATITSPTTASTYTTTTQTFSIGGTASDDLGVVSVAWVDSAGGSGTCTGTTSWTASGITLTVGKNVFTVTATDYAGNTAVATLTVIYDRVAPVVKIASPTIRRSYHASTSTLSIGGTAADVNGITKVAWSNLRGGSGTCTGTTSWSASGITLLPGRNVITVTATDVDGGTRSTHLIVFYSASAQNVLLAGIASDSSVWYSKDLSNWVNIPGKLAQIVVGDFNADGLFDIAGIASDNSIWYTTNESTWNRVPGLLKSMVTGDFNGDGKYDLAGISSDGQIWYTTDLQTWKNIPGHLASLAVGDFAGNGEDCLAGLASDGTIWYTIDFSTWTQIPGLLSQIAAADLAGTRTDGLVGIASDSSVWYSTNLSTWKQIPGRLSNLTVGDLDGDGYDDIAGTASNLTTWYATDLENWIPLMRQMNLLVAADLDGNTNTDLAGLAADGSISYTLDLQNWTSIPGFLSKLSAAGR